LAADDGQLAGRLAGAEVQPYGDDGSTADIDELWIGLRRSIEIDHEEMEQHERVLRELVEQRNELVHGFPPGWQAAVAGDADAVIGDLYSQYQRAMDTLERLRGWAQVEEAALNEQAAFLASPQGQRGIEVALLRSRGAVALHRADRHDDMPGRHDVAGACTAAARRPTCSAARCAAAGSSRSSRPCDASSAASPRPRSAATPGCEPATLRARKSVPAITARVT
jgi:hypothetical protein